MVDAGIDVAYFPVDGTGISGYLKAAFSLRKYLRKTPFDLIHAHYTLSGWATVLAFPKTAIALSLMGTDAYGDFIGVKQVRLSSKYLILLTYLIQPFVDVIICKSEFIQRFVWIKKKSFIIPNGILLDRVTVHKRDFRKDLGLDTKRKYVLFLGNKSSQRKNFKLLEDAFSFIEAEDVCLLAPYPISHSDVIKYLKSVDVLVVPSFMEGSPNVVKEAMACNCPVVATDVGDIAWLFGEEPGYLLAGFEPRDVADKIQEALTFSTSVGNTNGLERLLKLGLDSETVARNLIAVYEEALRRI